MNEQRYILTIQNSNIFKEVDVSKDTPLLKIGTLQECDVRLKGDLFALPVCVTLKMEGDAWRLACDETLYISSREVKDCRETSINHGDIVDIHSADDKAALFTLSFSYDFTVSAIDFDTIIDVRGINSLVIGNSPSAQLKLTSRLIGPEYLILARRQDGVFTLDAAHAPTSATLNGIRLFGSAVIQEFDFIGIADYSFYFKNQVLYTTTRDDLRISGVSSQPLRDETPAFDYPKLNRGPRMLYALNTEPIEILNPPKKPDKPRENLILQLSPALAMIALTVVIRGGLIGGMNTGNSTFLIFSVSMMAVGIFTSLLSFIYNRKRYKKDMAEWHSDYTAYIASKRREIELEQQGEADALSDIYPPAENVRDFVKTFSGRIFERSPQDNDFLHVRAGLGAVPALREPTYHQEEHIKIENELMHIPAQICFEYALINKAPVMLHLRESGSVGVVGSPVEQYEFFKNILLDVCVQHDYEEAQIVILIPRTEQQKYEWIKWLPHIKESGGGIRGIVCDDESRDNVFEYLYALMADRAANDRVIPLPYMVVFVLDEYGIKTHPLFKFVEDSAKLGVSFVYFKEYAENLPRCCSEIVELNQGGGILRLRNSKAFARPFSREPVKDDSIKFVAERLAPVFCEKIALSSRLTASITLFELLNIISPENLDLIDRWSKANVQKSLAAPLGVDVKGGQISLDLHEKAHGPHGLVAGTTGSGKSEIMQSYILSAAVNFHPYEVSFVIIDFKGGGMANQFENLPHLIGKITDIDSHEINRSLLSIRAELEKRKRFFAEYEVNHIDHYIAKFRSGLTKTPLPHLIVIVDEFAELKAEQPEFMKELISAARVGRSLGIHLILATQKPAGQVNEQIWSNSRFKLCLKVASKEDSNEVIKSPLASEIREPGRAYLQVGNNEIFTLFQSAYSGASAVSDQNGNIREFVISEVSFTGKRTVVYERKAERAGDGAKITQLKAMVDYIDRYCVGSGIARLPSICLPPLPEIAAYESTDNVTAIGTVIRAGIYDDPGNQIQPNVEINLSAGNVMIVGSAQTGKTMLLQTILRGIAERYSPKQASIYILDFASKVMKIFDGLNHVGGVLTDADDEALKNFFKMMREELSERKERFSALGISSYEAYLEMGKTDAHAMPHIIIMADNLAVFKDAYQDYEDAMLNICREGLAVGITVIATAKQTSGLSYRYMSNFSTRLAFNCTESSEYNNIFDRCPLRPKNLQGRGLVSIDKVVYEYQAFLPFDGEKESQRIAQAREFIAGIAKVYGAERARAVPSIPPVLTDDFWKSGGYEFGKFMIPVGLTYSEIEPVAVDLARVGTVGIYGREGFGKSNLVRVILSYLQKHVFDSPCAAYLVDGYDRQLAEFETCGFVERYTVDCAEFEEIMQTFSAAAVSRMDILRGGGDLDQEPLLLCVVQNSRIFAANAVTKEVSDQFKKLITDAKQLKICFVFANVDNNADFSVPEMMRTAREFAQYFLLDDIANVKLFGSSKFQPNDLRPYKKPIILGDAYTYDSRNGIEKVKLMKCERSV
ncbi:MAG: type VII secretion protein EssC [Gracilibacteraceae bacterium]|jgi:S-DNA-T family DNA segregation ATPase FtsK/SpoIIIE|nr:type VII secretion protein EssC [Gracilibacteraceae bacterium]